MPRTTHERYAEWKYHGKRVGYVRERLYYIDRHIAGRRLRFSTGCITLEAANAEYARFELNPAAYVNRGGRRVFTPKRGRGVGSDPVRAARLRENHLDRAYRLAPGEYAALLLAQGHRCAICETPAAEADGAVLEVDHCHATGLVRGLLCGPCNRGIGQLRDSPDTLRRALAYLEERRPEVTPRPIPERQRAIPVAQNRP